MLVSPESKCGLKKNNFKKMRGNILIMKGNILFAGGNALNLI